MRRIKLSESSSPKYFLDLPKVIRHKISHSIFLCQILKRIIVPFLKVIIVGRTLVINALQLSLPMTLSALRAVFSNGIGNLHRCLDPFVQIGSRVSAYHLCCVREDWLSDHG